MIECLTQGLLSSHWNIYHSTTAYFFEPPCRINTAISDGRVCQIDMDSEVSDELGEVIVDKETARASYVLLLF